MAIYIKKYTGDNYFRNRTYVDSIVMEEIPPDSLPKFGYETENQAEVGQYRAGDFDLTFHFLQEEISALGYNIKDFLLGSDRDFYLLVCFVNGSQSFCGTVQAGQITADYDEETVTLIVKDIGLEWANRCSMVASSTINWQGGTLYTFEQYIPIHFAGITSDVVLLSLPTGTYLSRLVSYGNPGECFAFKDFFDFISGKENISRWDSFKQLALGMGFNFEMYLNVGTEVLNEPEFIFNIFFITDLQDVTPISVEVTKHNEFTTAKRLEWLFLRYRYFTLSGVGYSQGILFNSSTSYYTDTDQSDGETLYPAITLTLNDKLINVTDNIGNAIKSVVRDIDCKEFEIENYSYSLSSGGGIGKLYPLTEQGVTGGGMAFCHIFHTTINPSRYDFNPIQRYAITQYRRYLKGLQKAKSLEVVFDETTEIKLWQVVEFDDGDSIDTYFISAVRNIDLENERAEIEMIKLIE